MPVTAAAVVLPVVGLRLDTALPVATFTGDELPPPQAESSRPPLIVRQAKVSLLNFIIFSLIVKVEKVPYRNTAKGTDHFLRVSI